MDVTRDEETFVLPTDPSGPLVALAFKLEEGKYGQLTYVRVYSGTLQKGSTITNVASGKRHKVPRLVRTHSDELEDIDSVTVRRSAHLTGVSSTSLLCVALRWMAQRSHNAGANAQCGCLQAERMANTSRHRHALVHAPARQMRGFKLPVHASAQHVAPLLQAGEICAMFGLDCASGTTFTQGANVTMTSMKVPDPVVSLAVTPQTSDTQNFFKALARFQREDPTFRVHTDNESGEIIMSGMGELHLEVYAERIRREYNIACTIGNPKVRCDCDVSATCAPHVKKQDHGCCFCFCLPRSMRLPFTPLAPSTLRLFDSGWAPL